MHEAVSTQDVSLSVSRKERIKLLVLTLELYKWTIPRRENESSKNLLLYEEKTVGEEIKLSLNSCNRKLDSTLLRALYIS